MASGSGMSRRELLIRQLAQQRGVDPNAVVADSLGEGAAALHGGNSIGDHGTSFGPFQLHAGGALPASVWAHGAAYANQWANSRAGLTYALDRIQSVAQGLHGKQAVAAIVSRFERPSDIPGQIQRRIGFLQNAGGVGPVTYPPSSDGKGGLGPLRQNNPLAGPDPRQVIAATLLQASTDAVNGKVPDFGGILAIAQARRQQQAAQEQFGPAPTTGPLVGPGMKGGQGLSFTGGSLSGENQAFIGKVSAAARAAGATQIRVNSGARSAAHNAAVGGAPNSNHLTGHALDGEGFVPGKGWVPLGTLLAPVAPRFGLRSGATFNWGGKPDVVHVDDATNQRA